MTRIHSHTELLRSDCDNAKIFLLCHPTLERVNLNNKDYNHNLVRISSTHLTDKRIKSRSLIQAKQTGSINGESLTVHGSAEDKKAMLVYWLYTNESISAMIWGLKVFQHLLLTLRRMSCFPKNAGFIYGQSSSS